MAILLLLHEPPKDEPAQQQDVANSFSNRSDGRPVSGVQPNSFRRRCRATEKSPSLAEGLVIYLKKFVIVEFMRLCSRVTTPRETQHLEGNGHGLFSAAPKQKV
jgi:hypothetical protein